MTLPKQLKEALARNREGSPRSAPAVPLWEGPCSDGPQGGVTQGLLSHYLSCGERFRLKVIDGWKPADSWNHRLGYGNLWHVCEEALAARAPQDSREWSDGQSRSWESALRNYAKAEAAKYPKQAEQIIHWYEVCRVQFPEYVKYWREHPDVKERTPLLQEQVFRVPYRLPSGRTVQLRGKWDSVDVIGKGKAARVYLQENKTKGDVREGQLQRQLLWDLQTMFYTEALLSSDYAFEFRDRLNDAGADLHSQDVLGGVRYNVIRRPLSGGKGTIVRHKPTKANPAGESREAFYARLAEYIRAEPQTYFFRWRSEVTAADLTRFRRQCLDPVLENLCDDWEWWSYCAGYREGAAVGDGRPPLSEFDYVTREEVYPEHRHRHFRLPYGTFNPIAEGGESDLDALLDRGSTVGLERATTLFPELE